MNVKERLSCVF